MSMQNPAGYKPQAVDTNVASDRVFFALLRQRTASQRLHMGIGMIQQARRFSLACLRQQSANLSFEAFAQKVARAWLQEDYPTTLTPTGSDMSWIQDSTMLAGRLHRILENLEIPYYITGGMAAIAYGEPRTTRDLDVVLSISLTNLDALVRRLEAEEFYVPGVEDVKSGRLQTLGVTHIPTIARADLILSEEGEFDIVKFTRRRLIEIPEVGAVYFASPEDTVLSKIHWGMQSQSEKQWRDILGILKVQAEQLDCDYLNRWAAKLGFSERLTQALVEAGISE